MILKTLDIIAKLQELPDYPVVYSLDCDECGGLVIRDIEIVTAYKSSNFTDNWQNYIQIYEKNHIFYHEEDWAREDLEKVIWIS